MKKLFKFFFQVLFLGVSVFIGLLAAREWKRNERYYKSRFVGIRNRVGRDLEVGRESALQTANELRAQFQHESELVLKEAAIKAEEFKASKTVKKAVAVIEKVLPIDIKSESKPESKPETKSELKPEVKSEKFESKDLKGLSPRQNVIFAIIRGKKQVEMKDLLMRVSGVTERTLRRDLLKLQELKLISKKGTTKSVTYVLK
jgi:hypothetical protein